MADSFPVHVYMPIFLKAQDQSNRAHDRLMLSDWSGIYIRCLNHVVRSLESFHMTQNIGIGM